MLATSKCCLQTKINSYNKHNGNYIRSEVGPVLISTDIHNPNWGMLQSIQNFYCKDNVSNKQKLCANKDKQL